MNKKLFPSRLGAYIVLSLLCALIVSGGLFFALQAISDSVISKRFTNSSVTERQTLQELNNFQTFITNNNISSQDIQSIKKWVIGEKYCLINIYKNDYLIYSSSAPSFINPSSYKKQDITPSWRRLYRVDFADGVADVDIVLLASSRFYDIALIVELALSFLSFTLIFLAMLTIKIRYINRLSNELKILEGGDLSYRVTVKGKDEITFLAQGIDQMRQSFLERIKSEKEARHANSELITSISHDLRTPLTILIGILDVVANNKYKTEEQLNHYLLSSREKAYQIKDLSDKLFEYFLIYGSENREPEMEVFESRTLLSQIIGEHALSLEDDGFTVENRSEIPEGRICVNLISVRRVFDNLFSNVRKYADPAEPVAISYDQPADMLAITIRNRKADIHPSLQSTNIGLITCEKIMAQHRGALSVYNSGQTFSVTVRFPVLTECEKDISE